MTKNECIEKLKEIGQYKDNWDNLGAKAFKPSFISELTILMSEFDDKIEFPYMIIPMNDNSITFLYVKNKEKISDDYVELRLIVSEKNVASHIHLLQHQSGAVLMKYSRENVMNSVTDFLDNF